jgi:hypothetical protein
MEFINPFLLLIVVAGSTGLRALWISPKGLRKLAVRFIARAEGLEACAAAEEDGLRRWGQILACKNKAELSQNFAGEL